MSQEVTEVWNIYPEHIFVNLYFCAILAKSLLNLHLIKYVFILFSFVVGDSLRYNIYR